MAYRGQLASGASAEDAERQLGGIIDLLQLAEQKLDADRLDAGALFGSSLLILLREGLEAILVLAAIIAFLVKSGRRDAMPWVHFGWVTALVAGAATWFVATYVVSISGASREMTEAVSALVCGGDAALHRRVAALQGERARLAALPPRAGRRRTGPQDAVGAGERVVPRGVSRALRDRALLPGAVGAGRRRRRRSPARGHGRGRRDAGARRLGRCSATACACRSTDSSRRRRWCWPFSP